MNAGQSRGLEVNEFVASSCMRSEQRREIQKKSIKSDELKYSLLSLVGDVLRRGKISFFVYMGKFRILRWNFLPLQLKLCPDK